MVTGLESAFPEIYLKSGKTSKTLVGNECFYIHTKAEHYYEFNSRFQVTLPKNLARVLGYLNHHDHVPALFYCISAPNLVQLQKDQSVIPKATTTKVRRRDEIV